MYYFMCVILFPFKKKTVIFRVSIEFFFLFCLCKKKKKKKRRERSLEENNNTTKRVPKRCVLLIRFSSSKSLSLSSF